MPKYPSSKKSTKKYAEYLTDLHKVRHIPIVRIKKIKNKFAINHAAVTDDELEYYVENGWKVIG